MLFTTSFSSFAEMLVRILRCYVPVFALPSLSYVGGQSLRGAQNECPLPVDQIQRCSCFEILQIQGFLQTGQAVSKVDVKSGYRKASRFYHEDKSGSLSGFVFLKSCEELLLGSGRDRYLKAIKNIAKRAKDRNFPEARLRDSIEDKNMEFIGQGGKRKATHVPRSKANFQESEDTLHLFLDNSGSMSWKDKLGLAHDVFVGLKPRLELSPTSVHMIGHASRQIFSVSDAYTIDEVLDTWKANGGATHLYEYIFSQMRSIGDSGHELAIITDGCDNASPAPMNTYNAMMKGLKDLGKSFRVHIIYIGSDPCQDMAGYRDLAAATGGIYSQAESIGDAASHKFVSHVTASHATRQSAALGFRRGYENRLANGEALALPWYAPLTTSERKQAVQSASDAPKKPWEGGFVDLAANLGHISKLGKFVSVEL